jgi:hypothetical protein
MTFISDPAAAIRELQQRVKVIEQQLRLHWKRGAASRYLHLYPHLTTETLCQELFVSHDLLRDCQRFAQMYPESEIPSLACQGLTMAHLSVLMQIEDADRRQEMRDALVRGEITLDQLRQDIQAEQTRERPANAEPQR